MKIKYYSSVDKSLNFFKYINKYTKKNIAKKFIVIINHSSVQPIFIAASAQKKKKLYELLLIVSDKYLKNNDIHDTKTNLYQSIIKLNICNHWTIIDKITQNFLFV